MVPIKIFKLLVWLFAKRMGNPFSKDGVGGDFIGTVSVAGTSRDIFTDTAATLNFIVLKVK